MRNPNNIQKQSLLPVISKVPEQKSIKRKREKTLPVTEPKQKSKMRKREKTFISRTINHHDITTEHPTPPPHGKDTQAVDSTENVQDFDSLENLTDDEIYYDDPNKNYFVDSDENIHEVDSNEDI